MFIYFVDKMAPLKNNNTKPSGTVVEQRKSGRTVMLPNRFQIEGINSEKELASYIDPSIARKEDRHAKKQVHI
jgi:hypothetical protein